MASKRTKEPHRYPGRPFLLDNTPELEEFWIKSTTAEIRQGKLVQPLDLPPFCVIAYETSDSFIGRRKGVDSTHPAITWLKPLFERVEAPKDQ